ncbi:hypothetical protein DFR44_12133, partial [Hydromonas duriensis]
MYSKKTKLSLLMCLLISSGVLPSYAQEVVAGSVEGTGQTQAAASGEAILVAQANDKGAAATAQAAPAAPAVVRPLTKVLNLPNKGKVWV